MARQITLRQSLLRTLVVVILALTGIILAITYFARGRAVRTLSDSLIQATMDHIGGELRHFLAPAERMVVLGRRWIAADQIRIDGLIDDNGTPTERLGDLNALLAPFVDSDTPVSSLLISDGDHEYMLLADAGGGFTNRITTPDRDDSPYYHWTSDDPTPRPTGKVRKNYSPRDRPWFADAGEAVVIGMSMETMRTHISWTRPYTFLTTGDVGVTASSRVVGPRGDMVFAVDTQLNDISEFTTRQRLGPSGQGCVLVLTQDEIDGIPRDLVKEPVATIGLPSGVPDNWRELGYVGRTPRLMQEDHPLSIDASRAFATHVDVSEWEKMTEDRTETGDAALQRTVRPIRFESGGEVWWGQMRPHRLGANRRFFVCVMVAERDLVSGINQIRTGMIIAILVVLGIAVFRASGTARRVSAPIEDLVSRSDLISHGDLDAKDPIPSDITEVRHLADAQDRMRVGLQSLMKMERDMQLARQIQQSTFPEELPELEGFDLAAWSAPAEETGGDSYDLIGLSDNDSGGVTISAGGPADRALLMLADATGHGIGPALSVTQVRAMLRMAARAGESLTDITRYVNEQVHADLPPGRFITAWLGVLDGKRRVLSTLSAGQGPILHYDAKDAAFDVADADTFPLGVVPELGPLTVREIPLRPGDLYLVLSDGIFEAMNPDDKQFGTARVQEVVRAHADATAAEVLDALRDAVAVFADGRPPDDDQTLLVLRCTG